MPTDDAQSENATPSSWVPKENDTNMNQSQPPNPPEAPPPTTACAPEYSLSEKFQAAVRHIHTLEGQNTRLYEDNCRLVNAVNMLNERLTFISAPQNAQLQRLSEMQEKLRMIDGDRALIHRKYQGLLQSVSAGSPQRHLHEELRAARDAYASLEKEYHILADKYAKLKMTFQQHPQSKAPHVTHNFVPTARPQIANTTQFRPQDQSQNSHTSPTSATSPGSFHPLIDQNDSHRRRSSEGITVQSSLRSGPTPIATTWLPHLPTPPPSAPLPMGQISPTGFPVHTPVSAGSLPISHHPPAPHDLRSPFRLPVVTQPQHAVQQCTPEQPNMVTHLRQRCGQSSDMTNKGPVLCNIQAPPPASFNSSPRHQKRPNSDTRVPMSPSEEHKKPRVEADGPMAISADIHPARTPSPPASNDPPKEQKLPELNPTIRSYQDCVDLIFEKDADVENGIFCGLCLDRHEAGMIPEPPDVLVQSDFDLLVKHCMTEHPTVWNDLRHKA